MNLTRLVLKREMSFYKEAALDLIKGKTIFDAPMKQYTSIRVGGKADVLLFPKDIDELKKIVKKSRKMGIPYYILGNGTNLIVTDEGIRGWVISLNQGFKSMKVHQDEIEAEAGLPLKRLINLSIREGLTGLEAFAGIPGTVGGAIKMNAGAWGVEIKDRVRDVTFMTSSGRIIERERVKLKFSYRNLNIPDSWIILRANFRLRKGEKSEILKKIRSYLAVKRKFQPLGFPNAGSIFLNPKGYSAGKLIEESGLKGFKIGDAMISDMHGNFIINLGKAKSHEIINLIELIEKKVYEEKGILLKREVKIIGA